MVSGSGSYRYLRVYPGTVGIMDKVEFNKKREQRREVYSQLLEDYKYLESLKIKKGDDIL